ncbi:MAG: hypothetical protein NTX50_08235 [Candidatus Sumerlaeota bacterium]|nr:hypothetical protein [Candidatus Sumerlaeota bacterium]
MARPGVLKFFLHYITVLFLMACVCAGVFLHAAEGDGVASAAAGATSAGAKPDESIKAFCIDFNWGPGGVNGFAAPGLWGGASPEEHVKWYEALGCNVIQTFAVSCNGYAWYKDGAAPPQPGLKYDFLKDVVRLGHERKMRVMGYFCVGANTLWGQKHPDLSYGAPSAPHIPFTTEYLDYLSASIEDALRKTGMDGFMIDWVWNPGDGNLAPLKWLDCEQRMYRELMGEAFPGKDKISKERDLEFRRKAIDRCWERIRKAAKGAKADCVIWLSCSNVNSLTVINSKLFREVDWLMNEATDPRALAKLEEMKGPQTRLVQCVVGWGDRHDARRILSSAENLKFGIYGFAKPNPDSLPLPVEQYQKNPISSFKGNDRNIAVLARFYNGKALDEAIEQDAEGRIALTPETVITSGPSPIVIEGQIGHWGDGRDSVFWDFNVKRGGTFEITLTYACSKGFGGSAFTVEIDGKNFESITEETGPTWREYKPHAIGKIQLEAGRHTLSIRPSAKTKWKAMSVKLITLAPIDKAPQ